MERSVPSGKRRTAHCTAAAAVLALSWATQSHAERIMPTVPDAPTAPRAVEASASHAAMKGLTLKAITISTSFVIFSLGTGSVADGGVMAVMNGVAGYFIYVANEYSWDYLVPNTNVSSNNEGFRPGYSLTRNTAKYLTLKPMLTVLNVGIIYAFAPTLAATAATSTAAIVMLPMAYYANNTLWDWYDWHDNAATPAVGATKP